MPDVSPLEGKIHFLYDRTFDDIKKEVFCNWILEALQSEDIKVQPRQIEEFFQNKLGFDVNLSQKTYSLFKESLDEVINKRWVELRSTEFGDQKVYYYVCLDEGKKRLDLLRNQRQKLIDDCYNEFAVMIAQRIYQTNRPTSKPTAVDESDLDGFRGQYREPPLSMSESEAIKKIEELFTQEGVFKEGFIDFLKLISSDIADRLILGTWADPRRENMSETNRFDVEDVFRLNLIHDSIKRSEVKEAILKVFRRLRQFNLHSEPSLQHWFWLRAYEKLFEKIWPDPSEHERLSKYLECINVYLDTNIIIAALAQEDPLHRRARQILNFLYDNNVNFFWLQITDREFEGHLELTKGVINLLGQRTPKEISEIIELTTPPSLVKTFYKEGWRSWRQFELEIRERYASFRSTSGSQKVGELIENSKEYESLRSKYTIDFESQLKNLGYRRHYSLIRHDAVSLATVKILREMKPSLLIGKKCKEAFDSNQLALGELFWLISFDRSLEFLVNDRNTYIGKTEPPLTLLFETILLFLDPYIVSKALYEGKGGAPKAPQLQLKDQETLIEVIHRAQEGSKAAKSVIKYVREFNWDMAERYGNAEVI